MSLLKDAPIIWQYDEKHLIWLITDYNGNKILRRVNNIGFEDRMAIPDHVFEALKKDIKEGKFDDNNE